MSLLAPLVPVLAALLLPFVPTGGAVWPLDPRPEVVRRFDPPATQWGPGHRGVDLLGTPGQAVHAAAAGVVSFAGRIAGRGMVVVDHGATRTTYQPVDPAVAVGDRVPAGAVVGRLEATGSHCFPATCLHWGLIEGAATYRDPLTLVGAGPVRLLPLSGPWPSGPGVRLAVGLPQPVGGHVRVDLGGGQRGMAEQLLHGPQVRSALEQVGGRGVP